MKLEDATYATLRLTACVQSWSPRETCGPCQHATFVKFSVKGILSNFPLHLDESNR